MNMLNPILARLNKMPRAALITIGLFVALGTFAPWLAPQDPSTQNLLDAGLGPSAAHWLGTDHLGRDTFSRLIIAANTSLVSVIAMSELLYTVQLIYAATYQTVPMLLVASIWYIIVTTVLTVGQFYVERYFGRGSSRQQPRTPLQRLRRMLSSHPDVPPRETLHSMLMSGNRVQ